MLHTKEREMNVSVMPRYIVVLVSALLFCQSPASSSWEDEDSSSAEAQSIPTNDKKTNFICDDPLVTKFYEDGGRNCKAEHLLKMINQIPEPFRKKAMPSLLIADASFNRAWKQPNEWYRDLSALSELPEENQLGVLKAYLEVYVPESIQNEPYTYKVDAFSASRDNADELKIINRFPSYQRMKGASVYGRLQGYDRTDWGFKRLIKKLPQDRILSILEACYSDIFIYNSKPATIFLATIFLPEPTKSAFIVHHSERGAHFLDVAGWFKYDAVQDQEAMINHWRQELNMGNTNDSEALWWKEMNFQEPNGAVAYMVNTIAYNGALAEDHELVVKVRALKRERLMQKLSSTVRKVAEKTSREIIMSPQKYGIKYQDTDKLYQEAIRVAREFSKE